MVGTENESTRVKWLEKTLSAIPAGSRILDAGAGECQNQLPGPLPGTRIGGGQPRESLAIELALLEVPQDPTGAIHQGIGQARQLRHLNAIGAIGAPGCQAP